MTDWKDDDDFEKATRPDRKEAEIDALLERAGTSREELKLEDISPETVEPDWLDELKAEADAAPDPMTENINALQKSAKDALNLVPEGSTVIGLAKMNELGFELPPPVAAVIKKAGMSDDQAAGVLVHFQEFIVNVSEFSAKVYSNKVRDENDLEAIAQAKTDFITARDQLTALDNRRKIIGEIPLRQTQVINTTARWCRELLEPVRDYAKNESEFLINLEKERKQAIADERADKLRLFNVDSKDFDLLEMTEEAWAITYAGVRAKFEADEAVKKAELEERQKIERERIAENERLKEEADKARKEKEAAEAREKIEREEKEAAQKIIDDAKKAEADAEAARQAELDRLAKAPDREKAEKYFADLRAVERPDLATEEFKGVLNDCYADIKAAIDKALKRMEVK